jgi:hypothetical protein
MVKLARVQETGGGSASMVDGKAVATAELTLSAAEQAIPCHNHGQALAATLVSGRHAGLRDRRIPCHIPEEPPCPGRVVPLATARLVGEAAAAFSTQPDLAARG